MHICTKHGDDVVHEGETCPACQYIKKLDELIIAYEEELAGYARTVGRLNKKIKEWRNG